MSQSEKWEGKTGWVRVHLHSTDNPVLTFDGEGMDEPFLWGFDGIDRWREFLKALVRFDESLGVSQ